MVHVDAARLAVAGEVDVDVVSLYRDERRALGLPGERGAIVELGYAVDDLHGGEVDDAQDVGVGHLVRAGVIGVGDAAHVGIAVVDGGRARGLPGKAHAGKLGQGAVPGDAHLVEHAVIGDHVDRGAVIVGDHRAANLGRRERKRTHDLAGGGVDRGERARVVAQDEQVAHRSGTRPVVAAGVVLDAPDHGARGDLDAEVVPAPA